jgi:hypothetical protein
VPSSWLIKKTAPAKNPNLEIRNPKQNQNPKSECPKQDMFAFEILCFGFVSDFEIRISDFLPLVPEKIRRA